MSKERNTFRMIAYWCRVGQLGMLKEKFKKTMDWKRKDNASTRKACNELEKAF